MFNQIQPDPGQSGKTESTVTVEKMLLLVVINCAARVKYKTDQIKNDNQRNREDLWLNILTKDWREPGHQERGS